MDKVIVQTSYDSDVIISDTYIQHSDWREKIARNMINLRDSGVIEALVKMGWTPPEDKALTSEPNGE